MKKSAGSRPPSVRKSEGYQQVWNEFLHHTKGTPISREYIAPDYYECKGGEVIPRFTKKPDILPSKSTQD